ncbi:unnamed protein product [Thlaspi arvense]|uniref:DUF6821 domain-containing protein n=1 Tax=Thlaspi arvense TaxID=13288 RepID=A0AAU9SUX7_THLAR|nr:unnamed protein product [Thlaspi arvense]
MEAELLDWELVHGSDSESSDSIISSNKKSGSSSVIDDGIILFDHFSATNIINLHGATTDRSLESGDSSRVDNGSESPNQRHNTVEVLGDLGFDQLDLHDSKIGISGDGEVKVSDFEAADEKLVESEAVSEPTGGTVVSDCEDVRLFESDDVEVADGRNVESQSDVEEPVVDSSKPCSDSGEEELVSGDSGNVNDQGVIICDSVVSTEARQSDVEELVVDSSKPCSDSGEEELVSGDSGNVNDQEEIVCDGVVSTEAVEESGGNTEEVVAVDSAVRSCDESKSRETVWWKMPFVLVKYYSFRIGPVWSVSLAAAVMGFVLLGRRLYNMKKKAQRFHLKVTIDDKKVSRVMSQAARLNEVFTEVRRVPVIRPALPSPGAWPVLSLR